MNLNQLECEVDIDPIVERGGCATDTNAPGGTYNNLYLTHLVWQCVQKLISMSGVKNLPEASLAAAYRKLPRQSKCQLAIWAGLFLG